MRPKTQKYHYDGKYLKAIPGMRNEGRLDFFFRKCSTKHASLFFLRMSGATRERINRDELYLVNVDLADKETN